MTSNPAPGNDAGWLDQAGRILSGLGFALVEPDRLSGDDTTHLLVAIHPQPTMKHFDPEAIDYWTIDDGRGRAVRLDREERFPVTADYAWGTIVLTDRLGVTNQFLSFGGAVRAAMDAETTVVADFGSHAPILRSSGHSQSGDPLGAEAAAFFARIKVPIDFVPGAESLIARAAPRTLYCAFIQNVRERLIQARTLREANRWLSEWSSREGQHMENAAPDHWKAGADLRKQLVAVEAIARE